MENGDSRSKVQDNLYEIASSQLEQNNDTALLLARVTGVFLDSFLVNLRAELEDMKQKELSDQGIQNPNDSTQNNNNNDPNHIFDEYFSVKAIPNYRIINTNNICSTLKRMNFESIASRIESDSIEINLRIRDECFAAVRKLPFVSTDEHLLLARDLIASGIAADPDELIRAIDKKPPIISKKTTKKKVKKKKKRDTFFF